MGYVGLTAQLVETLESKVLTSPADLEQEISKGRGSVAFRDQPLRKGEILSCFFFSPKTTDVSRKVLPVAYSWRKVVRLRARNPSPAQTSGIESAYVLTISHESDLRKDPRLTPSDYTQVILARKTLGHTGWPLYWLIYEPSAKGARRKAYSVTSWDARDPRLASDEGTQILAGKPLEERQIDRKYYVPISCVQCHGQDSESGKLQYLDTDYWLDRLGPGEDFAAIGLSKWPALYDAGKNRHGKEYQKTFELIRQLNMEILDQNRFADKDSQVADKNRKPKSFQARATANWLQLHPRNTTAHIEPQFRGIPSDDGKMLWNDKNEPKSKRDEEAKLLPLLNQFCFRCHSSVIYNIYDKKAVLENEIDAMIKRISPEQLREDAKYKMPQDRNLTDREWHDLNEALKAVRDANPQ